MNRFSEYSKPTAEMLLQLLAEAYKNEIVIDRILQKASDEAIEEFLEVLENFDLDEEIVLRDHPKLYQIVKEAEKKVWDNIMEQAWLMMMTLTEKSLTNTYKETIFLTYKLFESEIPQAKDLYKMAEIQITDTYITKKVLPIPWCQDGKVYSERLYSNVANFQKKLNFVLEQGITEGKGMEWMTWAWRKLTGSTAYNTARLLKTETVAMWSQATKESYLNMGIEYVEIIGDAACGGICNDYVGEAIPLAEAELGDQLPPYHPNCACSYIAYEQEEDKSDLSSIEEFE